MMKIGVMVLFTEATAAPAVIAPRCEEMGFESLFIPEHQLVPPITKSYNHPNWQTLTGGEIPETFAHMPDQFVALATAAPVTKSIKLGTGICWVARHHPVALAKLVASADFYCGGRFLFGAGVGWMREEAEIMRVDFRHRWKLTREYLRAMREIWTREEPSFDGEFVSFPPIRTYPKPLQKPHPPIFIGAGGIGEQDCAQALRTTAEIADGWMPAVHGGPQWLATQVGKLKELCAQRGRDFSTLEISALISPSQDSDGQSVIGAYREAGAHRLIFQVPPLDQSRMERYLERVRSKYMA
jgi:probable F420-dependent oxidoreductase